MANVEKEMEKRPARWRLDTLEACIQDFLWRREPGGGMDVKADDIPAMCAEAIDFEHAVWIAVESRRRDGRMHTHQTKVKIDARREFGRRIIYWKMEGFQKAKLFDDWYDVLWGVRPTGIGPLTTYDVAVRTGAYLKLEPVSLYLHTGARLGWNAMWGRRRLPALDRVEPEFWPPALRRLSADLAEDFLCTYRDTLLRIRRDQNGVPI